MKANIFIKEPSENLFHISAGIYESKHITYCDLFYSKSSVLKINTHNISYTCPKCISNVELYESANTDPLWKRDYDIPFVWIINSRKYNHNKNYKGRSLNKFRRTRRNKYGINR